MARPVKPGLDYFPMDTDIFSDLRIRKLIKYQGGKAVTVYALLLCSIYKEGYYRRWDEELPFMFSELSGYDEAYIREAINCCLNVGLLDKALYESEGVLTSRGIQERYLKAAARGRRTACVISEYSLISSEEAPIIAEKTPISSEETPINSAKSTQSKGKERKINKKTSSGEDVKKDPPHDTTREIPEKNLRGDPAPPAAAPSPTQSAAPPSRPAPSDPIDACLAWVTDNADTLASECGAQAATVLLHARNIAESWRITNEWDRAKPRTHMASAIKARIRKERDSAPPQATSPIRQAETARRIAAEEDAERRERATARKIDARASLQAYLKAKGLPPDTNMADIAARQDPDTTDPLTHLTTHRTT